MIGWLNVFAKANKLVEAVETLQAEWKSNFSRRFFRTLTNTDLKRWDPDLSMKDLKVVWAGFTLSDESPKTKAEETLHRITRLNPTEALRMGNEEK